MSCPDIYIVPSKFLVNNSDNYYHFLFDQFFSLFVFFKKEDLLNKNPQITLSSKSPFDKIFNLLTEREIKYSKKSPKPSKDILFDHSQMYLGSDLIVNKCEDSLYLEKLNHSLLEFREYLFSKLGVEPQKEADNRIVIIKRKSTRVITNHNELLNKLKSMKLEVIETYLEELSFHDQVALIANTNILIGSHGSGLANALFLPRRAKVIEITPHGWGIDMYKKLAQNIDCSFHQIEGEYDENLYLEKVTKKIKEQKKKVKIITKENTDLESDYDLRSFVRNQNIKININKIILTWNENA